ncbi:MAG: DUF58 domain-containing protein, partial [Hyphococcus sp.]
IRQNEWEAAAAVYLWRDPSRSLDFTSSRELTTKRRRAEIIAIALTILLSQAGERIGILGEDRRPFHGRAAPGRILEALYTDDKEDTASAPPAAHLQTGARIVMLSDFFTDLDAIASKVRAFAAEGARGALVQICDPAEEDFPFEGRVEFQDLESRDRLVFGETSALSIDYRKKFAAHRDTLANIARSAGWTLIAHRTDKPAETALLSLYTALGDPGQRF